MSFTVELLCPSASLEMSVYVITKKEDLIWKNKSSAIFDVAGGEGSLINSDFLKVPKLIYWKL